MNEKLSRFLTVAYEVKLLGKKADVAKLFDEYQSDPEFMAEARAEHARIKKLADICNLVDRDFASYQNYRALDDALGRMKDAAKVG